MAYVLIKPHRMAIVLWLVILILPNQTFSAKIEEGLFSSPEEKKNVLVSFGTMQEMRSIASQFTSSTYATYSKEDRIYAVYQAMSGYSTKCQSSAQDYLDSASYTYHNMWSSNTMVIKDADQACVNKLEGMSDVTAIRQDATFPMIDPVISGDTQVYSDINNTAPGTFSIGMSWGLTVMRVQEAWEYGTSDNYGYGQGPLKTGTGIIIGSIDTGVNRDHVNLHDNWRSKAGWMDGYNASTTPTDANGHGSHTVGTMCGKDGIGVAPGAQWIACRGCFERDCLESALLKCCQWMLCPHDMNQSEPENYQYCSLAPDLVSNSWGGGQGDLSFERCALALRAAYIVPIWAIGNAGPNCTTASSPGDLEHVIGVGATDENDELCKFSSRGPTVDGRLKPDVSAPGMHIKSCWFNSSTSFFTISGTSMATPHVSGLVALILERCRLPYQTVLNILQTTADRTNLGQTSQVCGGTPSDTFPNNFFGHGRVNALKAVQEAVKICRMNRYNSQINSGNFYQPQPQNYPPYY